MPGPVLVNPRGMLEPSPEVRRRLRQVHPGLDLKYSPASTHAWLITMDWAPGNERWQWVKDGTTNPADAWDTIGYLPLHCGVDDAPQYLHKALREHPVDAVKQLTGRLQHYNDLVAQQQVAEVTEAVMSAPDPTNPDVPKKVTGRRTRHIVPKE